MDIKATQLDELPDDLEPGTLYLIRQPGGTCALFVTGLDGIPYRVVGPADSGTPPPTEVTRSGPITNRLTLTGPSDVRQIIRPSVNIPLTSVLIENASKSGNVAIALIALNSADPSYAAAAVTEGSHLRGTMPAGAMLLAGRDYYLHVGQLGNGINGTAYTGSLSSIQLSSGHTWTGLATVGNPSYYSGTAQTVPAPEAQIAAQYVTGDMTGTDRSGLTFRAVAPAVVTLDRATRTVTTSLQTEPGEPTAISSGVSGGATNGGRSAFVELTPTETVYLYGANAAHQSGNTVVLQVWAADGTLLGQSPGVPNATDALLPAPLRLDAGQTSRIGYRGALAQSQFRRVVSNTPPVWDGFAVGSLFTSALDDQFPTVALNDGGVPAFDLLVGQPGVALIGHRHAPSEIEGLPSILAAYGVELADHETRLTTLETAPPNGGSTFAASDIVGADGGGSAGTYQYVSGGVFTIINFNTVLSGSAANFNLSTDIWTCPTTGEYTIGIGMQADLPGGTEYYVFIYVNGQRSRDILHDRTPSAGYYGGANSVSLPLNSGDQVTARVYFDPYGGTVVGHTFRTFASFTRIR
ncbi:hypothetical protein GO986_19740 [Deinococcus sp. HMF7620]|uniref:C1q domain-containing protein n=1 Tax=Deinococcus arboris TaxID=2682977 RepID=A0A7C9LPN2_9DEIO|nr:hypothetical protein [Deinococcus arboris]MVN88977.1 hypothetical protein [Deinococcus arboris]